MELPERFHLGKQHKNSISVIAFISLKHGVFVKLLTGSKVPTSSWLQDLMPNKTYTNKHGQPAARMTAEEYEDCVRDAMAYFCRPLGTERARLLMQSRMRLVHDRSTCHPRTDIVLDGKGATLKTIMAPPRSPDLMPLDYAVFGTVKSLLLREVSQHCKWHTKAERFVEELRAFDVTNAIHAYPKRLQYCKDGGGRRADKRPR